MMTYLDLTNPVTGLALAALMMALLFAGRGFCCWYLKLSQMTDLLRSIQDELRILNTSLPSSISNAVAPPKRESEPTRPSNDRNTPPSEIVLERPVTTWLPAAPVPSVPAREEMRLEPMGANVLFTRTDSPIVIPLEDYQGKNSTFSSAKPARSVDAGKTTPEPAKKRCVQTGDNQLPSPLPPL